MVPPIPYLIQPAHRKKSFQSALPSNDGVSSTPRPPNETCPEVQKSRSRRRCGRRSHDLLPAPTSAAHAQHDEEFALLVGVRIGVLFFFLPVRCASLSLSMPTLRSTSSQRSPTSRSCVQLPEHQRLSRGCDADTCDAALAVTTVCFSDEGATLNRRDPPASCSPPLGRMALSCSTPLLLLCSIQPAHQPLPLSPTLRSPPPSIKPIYELLGASSFPLIPLRLLTSPCYDACLHWPGEPLKWTKGNTSCDFCMRDLWWSRHASLCAEEAFWACSSDFFCSACSLMEFDPI